MEPLIYKNFSSLQETIRYIQNPQNIEQMKKDYLPEEGYHGDVNIVLWRIEITKE